MNFQLMSVPQLQQFVRANSIACEDRRYRVHLESAIATWESTQALAAEVKEAAIASAAEAVDVAVLAEIKAAELVVKVIEVLTTPTAIALYKGAFRVLMIAVTFTVLMFLATLKWCWSHRRDSAIWHWCSAAIASQPVQESLKSIVVAWQTITIVLNAWRDWGRAELAAIIEAGLQRLGVGMCGDRSSVVLRTGD